MNNHKKWSASLRRNYPDQVMRVGSKALPLSMGSPSKIYYFTKASITVGFLFVNREFAWRETDAESIIVFLARL